MTSMRRALLLLPIVALAGLAACESPEGSGERAARTRQAFTSNESTLVDFDLDGSIHADESADDATLRTLIGAQLMYSIGALNADRSVGRLERLELSAIARRASGEVTYHAKLPVAWGSPSAAPATYRLTLPARATEKDQTAFAAKYGAACVDPDAGTGPIDPSRMFLFYRPERPGCVLGSEDVVTIDAKISPSTENTTGKYPEYDRIWDDGALRVVALFSRAEALDPSGPEDLGARAFLDFMLRATAHVKALSPTTMTTGGDSNGWNLGATLADGRRISIDARLVDHELASEGPLFDEWYDARTPDADLIVYSGHAGLGWNVRTLMSKGSFRAGKYVIWSVNGCDTFAYVDRTLAKRRALVNPDDPSGTKYMDVVSNVMAGFFDTGPATTLTLVDALASAPQTYRDIFARIDPKQVVVVTGEEDNAFIPKGEAAPSSTASAADSLPPEPDDDPPPSSVDGPSEEARARACAAAPSGHSRSRSVHAFVAALVGVLVARRRSAKLNARDAVTRWRDCRSNADSRRSDPRRHTRDGRRLRGRRRGELRLGPDRRRRSATSLRRRSRSCRAPGSRASSSRAPCRRTRRRCPRTARW